jgi:hypothetical protein
MLDNHPQQIKPDAEDYAAVERDYGALPATASTAECARHYQLAQATKLLRLYRQGKLPAEETRVLDRMSAAKNAK